MTTKDNPALSSGPESSASGQSASPSNPGQISTVPGAQGGRDATSLTDQAQRAGSTVADVATSVASDLKSVAGEKLHNAMSEVSNQAEEAKTSVADEVSGVADSLRHAARELRSGSPQERTLGMIADGLADASETMRNRDLGELLEDVRGLARRNPMMFIGGAVLLGFAAARYGKATQHGTTDHAASGAM